MQSLKCDTNLGFPNDQDEEVNALVYMNFEGQATSYLAVAGNSGKIVVLDLSTMEACFEEANYIPSEIVNLFYRKSSGGASSSPLG